MKDVRRHVVRWLNRTDVEFTANDLAIELPDLTFEQVQFCLRAMTNRGELYARLDPGRQSMIYWKRTSEWGRKCGRFSVSDELVSAMREIVNARHED